MKKIALFVDDINRQAFYARILGIHDRVLSDNLDVTLHIFRSRATYGLDPGYNIGEYNVFNLPEISEYDGFILDLYNVYQDENYWYGAEACHHLIDQVRKQGKPVIAIGNNIEGCYYVGIDNESAMYTIVDHLYSYHKSRTFWLIMGPADNVENRIRVRTCLDYLRDHTGKDFSGYVHYDSFESSSGQKGFRFLMDRYKELPDAIICANDRIAIGVAETAEKLGYRPPDDFLLTGFDNMDETVCMQPTLTTVDQHWVEPGGRCIEILRKLWEGETVDRSSCVIPASGLFRASCGCPSVYNDRIRQLRNANVYTDINRAVFDRHIDQLEYSLLSCDNLHDIGLCFQQSLFFLQCRGFYLVLDREFGHFRAENAFQETGEFGQAMEGSEFPEEGFPHGMNVVFGFEGGKLTMENKPVKGLFSIFKGKGNFRDYLFLPIHFQKYTMGYFAIWDSINLIRNPYLARAISSLTTAIENLYNQEKLRGYNHMLSDISITDGMTGFYNRLGYQQLAFRLFEKKKAAGQNLTILFIDMDNLKDMNDHYGHECGDYSLLAITKAIQSCCPTPALMVRMGGDEFLVILDRLPDEEVKALLAQIEAQIPLTQEALKLPYLPSVSVGYVHTDITVGKALNDYVREADKMMYEVKRQKKMAM